MQLPEDIETPRLVLRTVRESDASIIFDLYAQDESVTRYLTWKPNKEVSETIAFIKIALQAQLAGNRYPYALTLHSAPDAPIGMLDAKSGIHGAEFGYVLARRHWGSGYMPEAVSALADVALKTAFRVQAYCDIGNVASARTLEKSGFIREGLLERFTVHPNISSEPRSCYLYARCR